MIRISGQVSDFMDTGIAYGGVSVLVDGRVAAQWLMPLPDDPQPGPVIKPRPPVLAPKSPTAVSE